MYVVVENVDFGDKQTCLRITKGFLILILKLEKLGPNLFSLSLLLVQVWETLCAERGPAFLPGSSV